MAADAAEMTDALVRLLGEPGELERLRRTTTTSPPLVTPIDAMVAVDRLYRRARAMHEPVGGGEDLGGSAPHCHARQQRSPSDRNPAPCSAGWLLDGPVYASLDRGDEIGAQLQGGDDGVD